MARGAIRGGAEGAAFAQRVKEHERKTGKEREYGARTSKRGVAWLSRSFFPFRAAGGSARPAFGALGAPDNFRQGVRGAHLRKSEGSERKLSCGRSFVVDEAAALNTIRVAPAKGRA